MSDERTHPIVRLVRRLADAGDSQRTTDGELLRRWSAQRDEAAFELLVHRHGGLVWHVCRNLLREPQAAEDAFQATFLVLVRKAGAIGRPELLGNWLYGVAYRVAQRARKVLARREATERPGVETEMAAAEEPAGQEVAPLLHEELERLPAKYRRPMVLCYLEGRTNDEAARQLQWPLGTLKVRLMRGREMLRSRLARRGLALSAGTLASVLAPNAAPAALVDATVRGALAFAAGATGSLSAGALTLTEGVLATMWWNKARIVIALVLTVALLGTGAGLFAFWPVQRPAAEHTAVPAANAREAEPEKVADELLKSDRFAIKGTWTLVSAESAGKKKTISEEDVKKGTNRLTLGGDRFSLTDNGITHEGTCKLNPDKTPKQIDLVIPQPDEVPEVFLRGIYKLEKDQLTVCFNDPKRDFGFPRPADFATQEGQRFPTLVVYKRSGDSDEQKLQGTWEVTSLKLDGRPFDDALPLKKLVFKGDKLLAGFEHGEGEFAVKVDPFSKPAKIDLLGQDDSPYEGTMLLGVYSLDGDNLKICAVSSGKRPTELTVREGQVLRHVEFFLQRAKK
jgi:RNA polymerase sigma factor (sigma-70 family)